MRFRTWLGVSILALVVGAQPSYAQPQAGQPVRGVTDAVAAFAKAFNAHDATALAALWSEKAVHIATETGERMDGRAALAKAYAELFKQDPKCELAIQVGDVKLSAPTTANLEAVADVKHANGEVTRSTITAVLAQRGGAWLIDEVRETDVAPSTLHLNELAWLIGHWQGDVGKTRVTLDIHWAGNMHFLMGRMVHEENGAPTQEIVQLVGWDAEQHCLRSWQFNDGGGFAEGIWTPKGDNRWLNKLVRKFPDGRRGSMTQSLVKVSDDKITLQSIDCEVDGEPQPNSEVATLSRTAASPGDAKTKQSLK